MFLTHFDKKKPMLLEAELHEPRDYITSVINPHTWMIVWQWHHFLLSSNIRQAQPGIIMPNRVKPKIITWIRNMVQIIRSC